jgi:drug/metabolite transporter (DMT)-like permease
MIEPVSAQQVQLKSNLSTKAEGIFFGGLGVFAFSFSITATRAAAPELGGVFVGLGRALVASILAVILLLVLRERFPARKHWGGLLLVSLGVVIGFPLFSGLAMQSLPAVHGAVATGLLPAATAVMGVLRAGERPSRIFWAGCVAGIVAVLVFAMVEGAGHPQQGDILLLIAVALGGLGYAEGARIARDLGGWRVMCWALVITTPFLIVPVALSLGKHTVSASPHAWLGFAYVSVVSSFLGFFAWYRGLAAGGVAHIGQLQLVQPVLTLVWSALLLGESLRPTTVLVSLLHIGIAVIVQKARLPRKS